MTQEFVTLPREVVEHVRGALAYVGVGNASENPNLAQSTCRQAIWKLDHALRAALDRPQAEQPAMTPIAQRKLDSLLTEGYTISGYSVYHERKHQHGFVTGAGLVGWWKPEGMEYPQPQGEQEPRCLAGGARYKVTHLTNAGYCIHGLPREMLGQWVAFVDATDNKHMANQQPKREPLTDEQIADIVIDMNGNEPTALFWRDLARAIEVAHNIK